MTQGQEMLKQEKKKIINRMNDLDLSNKFFAERYEIKQSDISKAIAGDPSPRLVEIRQRIIKHIGLDL
ncbi:MULTISPECIES: hypothetical protein [Leuconostoc]|uniref:Transcriptional regulator n=1 Tax=Leuconostoc holzapfelii TaxID=434464 RepID=A0ABT2NVZ7_9LACO|nr:MULTISPECIES: hypothetical protein [Leuconostoc]KQB82446.1 hypothetical protein AN225_03005 [Leuconostoc lactis]MBU7536949.1 hypothetical protein [Leuconostoc lactis]MCC2745058.1 hypothetical protein [Leuconostoc lactis]MCC2755595.1 hypothetical protein [Leuconostoc lactis]MCT8389546.1 hypothetical protein [Leuconostoc holzapfelii]